EFAIMAALSGDPQMKQDYQSGDPYLRLAISSGAAPEEATKNTHEKVRDIYKTACLAIQYGQSAYGLAPRLSISLAEAKQILHQHQERYPVFWKWSNRVVSHAMLHSELGTVFGWKVRLGAKSDTNARSILNFPAQANGAEMLRLACCLGTEAAIEIHAPVHDAVLIGAPLD